ncbi:TlpA family protein disulfide reductase [Leptospira borgpetersenii]|uniref:Thioredoxin-like domain protein n=2 Tax=Leptospira borgpetersenii TaxID=174 RepID=A0A0E3BKH6_LEPBO|nr:thioredoxin-like domain-containing protein [Leptospira borgpetersenii]EMO08914.1 thioredoxin-like domain protein [Leptospira borgpetersenii str. Noumea 25]ALO26113.1 thioredoxin-like domain protein [Leptospira borgpetersenii serovar Ballum]ANH00854.1 Thioredoxin-like domain protein [Leptospira borgpetersenii str. 4E]AXX14538.1 thiol-disulfide isomerase [Leptospira borgpetersenii serovar Ceylonica]EKQ92036.1 thioredoxin-like domain protein [Leptospira borgpetersenii str. UI 09149]
MKEILKKSGNVTLWILLFLTITIVLSIFKASDVKPSISIDGMKSFEGERYDSKGRVTVVYFWATWCGVCSFHLPLIKWYSHQLENSFRFSFVSVEEGENLEELNQYIREKDLRFKVIPANISLLKEWKINSYPSFVILDRFGKIRFMDSGMMNPLSFFLRIWIVSFF